MVFKAKTVDEYSKTQDIEAIKAAAEKSKLIFDEIIASLKPGIKKSEMLTITKKIFAKHGITKS